LSDIYGSLGNKKQKVSNEESPKDKGDEAPMNISVEPIVEKKEKQKQQKQQASTSLPEASPQGKKKHAEEAGKMSEKMEIEQQQQSPKPIPAKKQQQQATIEQPEEQETVPPTKQSPKPATPATTTAKQPKTTTPKASIPDDGVIDLSVAIRKKAPAKKKK